MTGSINGGEVLCIGDLHVSDVFEGKHKNYLENCFKVLHDLKKVIEERKPSVVVFLGDIVGWTDTNIKSREVFSAFCRWFKSIADMGIKIYAVRGNHDMKGYPDYQFLIDVGLIHTCDYFDYCIDDHLEVRFHLVNYGEENRVLDIADGASNAVLAHNNFTIDGVTTWYSEHDGIELSTLDTFNHVDLVVSGHIHNPSPELVAVTMPSGNMCALFYTGCPTRPIKISNNYNQVWLVAFNYDRGSGETDYDMIPFDLEPYENLYYENDEIINEKSEEELAEEVRKEALADVLGDIMKYRMLQGDLLKQVDIIPNATPEAKELAKNYLQVAINRERAR